jgi:hypothetical protein
MGLITALILLTAAPQVSHSARVTVIASTAADTMLATDPLCRDEELLRFERGDEAARLWLPVDAWNALLGDADRDGQFDAPAGVDGLAWAPRGAGLPSLLDFWFTTDSDFQNWKDGDVLRVGPSGAIEIVIAEDTLRVALGTASAFDLDALARDPDGRLYFSLRDGLSVSVLGAIEDGDVLLYDPLGGGVSRPWVEADLQAWVDVAVPGAGAIGDVKSLAFDPDTDALLFTVQSPTAHDATVFSSERGGSIFEGFEEPDFGFLQSTELDALEALGTPVPQAAVIVADQPIVAPGQTFTLRVRHAVPHAVLYGVASNRRAPRPSTRGGFAIAAPELYAAARVWPTPGGMVTADGSGGVIVDIQAPNLPAGVPYLELYLQLWDGAGGGLSAPCAVRVQ